MFGMFGSKRSAEPVLEFVFYGCPEIPGVMRYRRRGVFSDFVGSGVMLATAISKALYTCSRPELTLATASLLELYAEHMTIAMKNGPVADDVQFYSTIPDSLEVVYSSDDQRLGERKYVFAYVPIKLGSVPILQTEWPSTFALADVLSMTRVLAKEFHKHDLTTMDPSIAYGFYGLLYHSLAKQYLMNPSLATRASSIIDVPRGAMETTMQRLKQAFA
jgi:hypothetical protein